MTTAPIPEYACARLASVYTSEELWAWLHWWFVVFISLFTLLYIASGQNSAKGATKKYNQGRETSTNALNLTELSGLIFFACIRISRILSWMLSSLAWIRLLSLNLIPVLLLSWGYHCQRSFAVACIVACFMLKRCWCRVSSMANFLLESSNSKM